MEEILKKLDNHPSWMTELNNHMMKAAMDKKQILIPANRYRHRSELTSFFHLFAAALLSSVPDVTIVYITSDKMLTQHVGRALCVTKPENGIVISNVAECIKYAVGGNQRTLYAVNQRINMRGDRNNVILYEYMDSSLHAKETFYYYVCPFLTLKCAALIMAGDSSGWLFNAISTSPQFSLYDPFANQKKETAEWAKENLALEDDS